MRKTTLCWLSFICLFTGQISLGQTVGDLTLSHNFTSYHDSTQCNTWVHTFYSISINNSFVGDQVEVIFNDGRPDYTQTNSTGVSPWVIPNFANDSIYFSDIEVAGNSLSENVNALIYQAKSGVDSILNPTYFQGGPLFTTTVANPCTFFSISGNVYDDVDASCTYSSGDTPYNLFQYIYFVTFPTFSSGYLASGVTNGFYQTQYFPVDLLDSVQVYLPSFYQFVFPQAGCVHTSYMLAANDHTNIDFILGCSTASNDVVVDGYTSSAVRPYLNFTFNPMVGNLGCNVFSGVLKVVLDPNVTYNAGLSSHPADWVNGDTLFFNFTNFNNLTNGGYWQSFSGNISLNASGSLNVGDSVCIEVISDYPTGDINPQNNDVIRCFPVVNSYDPNNKEVEPKGIGPEGFIAKDNAKLKYKINFQNTGNAPAINIAVIDTLASGLLIPSSLRIINSSHPMVPKWLAENIVQFNFDNINLIDSASNEPESHGYVVFEIDMVQGLAEGTIIKNKAEIYFDNNSAIVTNFAINTIEITTAGINDLDADQLAIFPNPTTSQLKILSEKNIESIQIIDLNGKTIYQKNEIHNNGYELSLESIEPGVYLANIQVNSVIYHRKIIKY